MVAGLPAEWGRGLWGERKVVMVTGLTKGREVSVGSV